MAATGTNPAARTRGRHDGVPARRNGKRVVRCAICHHERRLANCRVLDTVRPSVAELVVREHPSLTPEDPVCYGCLKRFRQKHVEDLLLAEKGELTRLDREVIRSLVNHETLTRNLDTQFSRKLTVGERLADHIAAFGGSWTFIISFFVVLVAWMAINILVLARHPFDPYPFILLNLVLSCLAAIQAPIIMMSQNRKEAKDRLRSENDYKVNLKAELQIRQLHEKIDYLTQQQWHRLLELQEFEIDLLEDRRRLKRK